MSHFKELCSCGIVLSQCRCAGKKSIIQSQEPCPHVEDPDASQIKKDYKALKKRMGGEYDDLSKGEVMLRLAQKWKRPVQEIKKILK